MRVIKAMTKALLTMLGIVGVAIFIAFVVRACQINPMYILGSISLIGLFAMTSIWFYVNDGAK